jgi:predicted RNA polymerase sigma factor
MPRARTGAGAPLYDVLAGVGPGPVDEVNRAVAHRRAFDPEAGLDVLEELDAGVLAGTNRSYPAREETLLERAARAGERGAHRGGRTDQARERACTPAPSGGAEPDARVPAEVNP